MTSSGVVPVELTCPAAEISGPCTGTLSLRTAHDVDVHGTPQKVTLGSSSFSVAAGHSRAIDVQLTGPNQTIVIDNSPLAVVGTAHVSDQAGNAATVKQTLTVTSP
jgi:hypothetical protein